MLIDFISGAFFGIMLTLACVGAVLAFERAKLIREIKAIEERMRLQEKMDSVSQPKETT